MAAISGGGPLRRSGRLKAVSPGNNGDNNEAGVLGQEAPYSSGRTVSGNARLSKAGTDKQGGTWETRLVRRNRAREAEDSSLNDSDRNGHVSEGKHSGLTQVQPPGKSRAPSPKNIDIPTKNKAPSPEQSATPNKSKVLSPAQSATPNKSKVLSPAQSATPTKNKALSPRNVGTPTKGEASNPRMAETPTKSKDPSPTKAGTPNKHERASPIKSVASRSSKAHSPIKDKGLIPVRTGPTNAQYPITDNTPSPIKSPVNENLQSPAKAGSPVKGKAASPLKAESSAKGKASSPLKAESPVKGKASNPLKAESSAKGKASSPLKAESPAKGKASNPLKAESSAKGKASSPLKAESPVKGKASNPLKAESSAKGKASSPLKAESPAKGKASNPLKAESSAKGKASSPLKAESPVKGKVLSPVKAGSLCKTSPMNAKGASKRKAQSPSRGASLSKKKVSSPAEEESPSKEKALTLLNGAGKGTVRSPVKSGFINKRKAVSPTSNGSPSKRKVTRPAEIGCVSLNKVANVTEIGLDSGTKLENHIEVGSVTEAKAQCIAEVYSLKDHENIRYKEPSIKHGTRSPGKQRLLNNVQGVFDNEHSAGQKVQVPDERRIHGFSESDPSSLSVSSRAKDSGECGPSRESRAQDPSELGLSREPRSSIHGTQSSVRDPRIRCCSKQIVQEVLAKCSEFSKEVMESQQHVSSEMREQELRNCIWDFEKAFQENVTINGQEWHEAPETQNEPDIKILEDKLDDAIVDTAMKRKRYPRKILSHVVKMLKTEREILAQTKPAVQPEEIKFDSQQASRMVDLTEVTSNLSKHISETMKALPAQIEKANGFSHVLSLQPILESSRTRKEIFCSQVKLVDLAKKLPRPLETTPRETEAKMRLSPALTRRRQKSQSPESKLYPLRSKRKISLSS